MAYNTLSFFVQGPSTLTELSLPDFTDVASLKQKLYPATGIPPATQLLSCNGAAITGDSAPLSSFNLDGQTLQVSTSDQTLLHTLKSYNDDEAAEKFELTDQQYEARRDTVRAYKQRLGLGRFAPEDPSTAAAAQPAQPEIPSDIQVGVRCQDHGGRRGTVAFVGQVPQIPTPKHAAPAIWVGVQWDEPVPRPAAPLASSSSSSAFMPALSAASPAAPAASKNDGSVKGVSYFNCKEGFGSFVKPERIQVGPQFSKEAWEEELDDL